jgi:hypothetical protein
MNPWGDCAYLCVCSTHHSLISVYPCCIVREDNSKKIEYKNNLSLFLFIQESLDAYGDSQKRVTRERADSCPRVYVSRFTFRLYLLRSLLAAVNLLLQSISLFATNTHAIVYMRKARLAEK